MKKSLLVALAGNPNAGKTSLFNALTGARQKVGNYPGVTVEKREGMVEHAGFSIRLIDLPGTYSLTAYSPDEVVTRDFLLEEKPDVIIDVLDSTNLERNLYLCLQFRELGMHVVGALNMTDEADAKGIFVDAGLLSGTLGIPFVKTVGKNGAGMEELLDAVVKAASTVSGGEAESGAGARLPGYGPELEARLSDLESLIEVDHSFTAKRPSRWMAIKLLENDSRAIEALKEHVHGMRVAAEAEKARSWLGKHFGRDSEIVVSEQRYAYIHGALREGLRQDKGSSRMQDPAVGIPAVPAKKSLDLTERIDRILMHELAGLPIFFLIVWGIFRFTFALGEYPASLLETLFGLLSETASRGLPEGLLKSLIVDGIIGGVGGVFSFVPLIVILFLCISFLEDTGYLSRAAFLTDRFLHFFGLHGQSFMPMMLGFGCTVPAIMATRTLKSPKDRIATILAVPFMSCGAKLPVYVLIAGTFFGKNAGDMVMLMYFSGVLLSLVSTLFLRKTVLRGATTPFVMELPPYRLPTLRGIAWHVGDKILDYMKRAGTVILAASVVIWILVSFPVLPAASSLSADASRPVHADSTAAGGIASAADAATLAERQLEYSFAGRAGRFIEPLLEPLGFNWKLGVALIPGFSAKELVVSTLGILYGAANESIEDQASLRQALRDDPGLDPLVALAFMMFILIMPPCLASLATIRAEAGNKWMLFQVGWSMGMAWLVAFLVRQGGLIFLGTA
jgi:ferrous iron transport protein B